MKYKLHTFLSQYLLTLEGINQNVYDKYAQALQMSFAQDGNSDGLTSLTEFMLYMVWQMNLGIEQIRLKGLKGPSPLPPPGALNSPVQPRSEDLPAQQPPQEPEPEPAPAPAPEATE